MTDDTLYFSSSEVMKGIRVLYNDTDLAMFKTRFFPNNKHTQEYVMSWFKMFGESPFHFWCAIDEDRREMLNFLVDEATSKELNRERGV